MFIALYPVRSMMQAPGQNPTPTLGLSLDQKKELLWGKKKAIAVRHLYNLGTYRVFSMIKQILKRSHPLVSASFDLLIVTEVCFGCFAISAVI